MRGAADLQHCVGRANEREIDERFGVGKKAGVLDAGKDWAGANYVAHGERCARDGGAEEEAGTDEEGAQHGGAEGRPMHWRKPSEHSNAVDLAFPV